MGRWRRTPRGIGGLLVLALAAAPSAALAAPATDAGLVVKTFKNFSPDQIVMGTVGCPQGSRAVGGGYGTDGPLQADSYYPRFDEPLGSAGKPLGAGRPARSWRARLDESPPGTYDYKISVVCSGRSDATAVTKRFRVPSDETGGAIAMCPQSSRAIGGGLVVPNGAQGHTLIVDTGPVRTGGTFPTAPQTGQAARGWAASAHNFNATQQRLETVAICSVDSKAVAHTITLDVPAGTAEAHLVSCPARARATGGGFVVPPFLSQPGTLPFNEAENTPVASGGIATTRTGSVPRLWFSALDNHTMSSIAADFIAICEPR